MERLLKLDQARLPDLHTNMNSFPQLLLKYLNAFLAQPQVTQ